MANATQVDITEDVAIAQVRETCKELGLDLDWCEIYPVEYHRYGREPGDAPRVTTVWIIHTSVKLLKNWSSPRTAAPLLRQSLAQWIAEAKHVHSLYARKGTA